MNSLNVTGCLVMTSSMTDASSSSCGSSQPETWGMFWKCAAVMMMTMMMVMMMSWRVLKRPPVQTNTWDRLQKHKDDMLKQSVSARVEFQQEILQTIVTLNITKLFLDQNHQNITHYFFVSFLFWIRLSCELKDQTMKEFLHSVNLFLTHNITI